MSFGFVFMMGITLMLFQIPVLFCDKDEKIAVKKTPAEDGRRLE